MQQSITANENVQDKDPKQKRLCAEFDSEAYRMRLSNVKFIKKRLKRFAITGKNRNIAKKITKTR